MDTKALRQKILDLAIRGKLVPQDLNDEPASVLLERIRAEKERLIAEGKIKRPKKSKSSSSVSHYQNFTPPFPIPDSWEWVRLGDIAEVKGGTTIPLEQERDKGTLPYIKVSDLNTPANSVEITVSNRYVDEWKDSQVIKVNSILFPKRGGAIFTDKKRFTRNELLADLNIMSVHPFFCFDFVFLWFNSFSLSKIQSGSNIPQINNQDLEPLMLPLPPIEEQRRICHKANLLLEIINQIKDNKHEIQDIVANSKSKILELAMQGKLVPQDPTDESATDMLRRVNPKARIITDNPHYPKWLCSYLGDICEFERGITFPSDAKRFDKVPGYIACLRTANVHDEVDLSSLWYISEEYLKGNDAKKLNAGDILMSTANSKELVGRSVIIRNLSEPATFGGFVTVLRTQILLPEFFILFLKYKTLKGDFSKIATQTTNIANLNTKILSTVITPVPPQIEQSRIIQRVNQLFSVLDEIEASLQS